MWIHLYAWNRTKVIHARSVNFVSFFTFEDQLRSQISFQVVYITATIPYIILIILFCFGVSREGSGNGLEALFKPDVSNFWCNNLFWFFSFRFECASSLWKRLSKDSTTRITKMTFGEAFSKFRILGRKFRSTSF